LEYNLQVEENTVYDPTSQALTVDAFFTFITIVENKKYLNKIEEVMA
jgi:hypothetical protein